MIDLEVPLRLLLQREVTEERSSLTHIALPKAHTGLPGQADTHGLYAHRVASLEPQHSTPSSLFSHQGLEEGKSHLVFVYGSCR